MELMPGAETHAEQPMALPQNLLHTCVQAENKAKSDNHLPNHG
jgi:hypothetical protein